MPNPRRRTCVDCNRDVDECGPLSSRYKCEDCGTAALLEAPRQIALKRGPYYQRWLEGQARRLSAEIEAARGNG